MLIIIEGEPCHLETQLVPPVRRTAGSVFRINVFGLGGPDFT